MKVFIDENMPYVRELFSHLGDAQAVPGRPVPAETLTDVDALMVRSITQVNEALLSGKAIRFVGTATTGTDHVDQAWLQQAGTGLSATPGCNTIAVVEYVFSSLLILAERDGLALRDHTAEIVGVGSVGRRLQKQLETLEIKTLLCDPPRVDRGDEDDFHSLDALVREANVLTFRTPLYKERLCETQYLTDESLINRLKPRATSINACRGPVVDNAALLKRLETGRPLSVMLSVWEPEPNLNVELLKRVDIGTVHIAGYTLEGKARGAAQVPEACGVFTDHPQQVVLDTLLPASEFGHITLHGPLDQPTLKRLVHLVYDVRRDDAPLWRVTGITNGFDKLHKSYQEHRGWPPLYIQCNDAQTVILLCQLGSNAVHRLVRQCPLDAPTGYFGRAALFLE